MALVFTNDICITVKVSPSNYSKIYLHYIIMYVVRDCRPLQMYTMYYDLVSSKQTRMR